MVANWWPACFSVGAGPVQGKHDVVPSHVSTIAKVSLVSRLLHTLWWVSLLYGERGQLTDPFPAQFELSSLDGTTGFTLNGIAKGDQSGISVSSAGDVNGDGVADLLIGAFRASAANRQEAGQTHVVFGRKTPFPSVVELSTLDGSTGFTLIGVGSNDQSGISVSSAGDVNGDGISDLLIGAPFADPGSRPKAGQTYVVFGRKTPFPSFMELSSLEGTTGFTLNGIGADDQSGSSVDSAGDVNGDGIADLLIGAWSATPDGRSKAGQTYVVFGRKSPFPSVVELSSLNGTNGVSFNGIAPGDWSGFSVSSAGDVNGDGVADLLIGANGADPGGRSLAGQTYVVLGRKTSFPAVVELSSLAGPTGFTLNGVAMGAKSGYSVSTAGDVNGDGVADLIIGALYAEPGGRSSAGQTYVVFGRKIPFAAVIELSSLDGTNGFTLNGISRNDLSSRSVSSAGDVNGDDVDDLHIGAIGAKVGGRISVGQTYVVYGRKTPYPSFVELSSLDGIIGFTLNGIAEADQSGISVSSARDVNGDGVADLLIGALYAAPDGRSAAGQTHVVFGRRAVDTFSSTRGITHSPRSPTSNRAITKLNATTSYPRSQKLPMSMSDEQTDTVGIVTSPMETPGQTSLGVPVGIAGGICAIVSAVAVAAYIVLRKCRSNEAGEIELEEPAKPPVDNAPLPNPYDRMPAIHAAYGDTSFTDLE